MRGDNWPRECMATPGRSARSDSIRLEVAAIAWGICAMYATILLALWFRA